MVLQMKHPAERLLFIASNLGDTRRAEQEIALWIQQTGCSPAHPDRTYSIYRDGVLAREWRLVERRRS